MLNKKEQLNFSNIKISEMKEKSRKSTTIATIPK